MKGLIQVSRSFFSSVLRCKTNTFLLNREFNIFNNRESPCLIQVSLESIESGACQLKVPFSLLFSRYK